MPARGGSKGLPRKNVRLLGGRPLLAWTAEAIRAAAVPGALAVLSTEDDEIAEAGRAAGLEVPFRRPHEHATDEAGAEDVALHALDWAEEKFGMAPESMMLLQPTSPFRSSLTIRVAMEMLDSMPEIDGVIAVKAVHRTLNTLFRMNDSLLLMPLSPGVSGANRRQATEPLFTPSGAIYLIRTEALRAGRSFFPNRIAGLRTNSIESIDIDDHDDWKIAESVAISGMT